jgi:hypothetical protein
MSGQTVHLEPIVLQGRAYAEGEEYPGDYEAAFTVTITNSVAHVSGCLGRVTLAGYRDFLKKLDAFKVTAVEFDRMSDGALRAKIHRQLSMKE